MKRVLAFPHGQPLASPALSHRRLRPDLSRLLRDDHPAAQDQQGREHLRRLGRRQLPPAAPREVPARLRRLGQRRGHLLPHRALRRIQVHPREAGRGAAGRLRPRDRADRDAAERLPDSAGGGPRLRGRRRDRHPRHPGRRARPAGPSSSRATRTSTSSSAPASCSSIRVAAAPRRWRRPGWTRPTPRSGWACRLARWSTSSRSWATARTTCRA